MKRVILYICIAALLCMMLCVPAMAESVNYYEILEFQETLSFTYSSSTPYFEISAYPECYYIDVLLRTESPITSASIKSKGTVTSLTRYVLGNNVYRLYGEVPSGIYESFQFLFGGLSTGNFIDFYSCKLYPMSPSPVELLGYVHVSSERAELNTDGWIRQTEYGEYVGSYENPSNMGLYIPYEFIMSAYVNSWRQYDYLTFGFRVECESISSIFAESDGVILPVEVSFLSVDNNSTFYDTGFDSINETGLWPYGQNSIAYVIVTVDVTSLERDAAIPQVRITGSTCISQDGFTDDPARLQLWTVNGSYKVAEVNPFVGFFVDLKNTLLGWYFEWKDKNEVSDQVQEDLEDNSSSITDKSDEVEEIISSTPTLPDIDSSFGEGGLPGFLDNFQADEFKDGFVVLGNVFNIVYESDLSWIFMTALILGLIGFILFGER